MKNMLINFFFFFLILQKSIAQETQENKTDKQSQTTQTTQTIRIACWDMKLASTQRETYYHDCHLITKYLKQSKIDLLVAQSVNCNYECAKCNKKHNNSYLDTIINNYKKIYNESWRYIILKVKDKKEFHHAILWNSKKLKKVGKPLALPVKHTFFKPTGRKLNDRQPWAVKFSAGKGKSDFIIVPIYNKSYNSSEALQQRELEIKQTLKQIPLIKKTFNDNDIIFIGRPFFKNNEHGAKLFSKYGYRNTNISEKPAYLEHALNHILLPEEQLEFFESEFFVLDETILDVSPATFETHCSPYYMGYTDIEILSDDDKS